MKEFFKNKKAFKNIKNNASCFSSDDQLHLITYYKRNTTTNLIIRNNQSPQTPAFKKNDLIYLFTCHDGDCELHNSTYIGQSTTTLSRRLTMHLATGGPKQHTFDSHKNTLNRETIVNNTKILALKTTHIVYLSLRPSLFANCNHPSTSN